MDELVQVINNDILWMNNTRATYRNGLDFRNLLIRLGARKAVVQNEQTQAVDLQIEFTPPDVEKIWQILKAHQVYMYQLQLENYKKYRET